MIGDDGNKDEVGLDETDDDVLDDDVLDDDSSSEDKMPDIGGDTVIDVSGELEALVEKLDKSDPDDVAHKREVRKRLEELAEQRDDELDSTFNFNLDEDI
jgi:hypothetical protein